MSFAKRRAVRTRRLFVIVPVIAALSLGSGAVASVGHHEVVSEDPVNYTPRVVPDSSVLRPHVTAIAQLGSRMYAGGTFSTIADKSGQEFTRSNFVIFDANTGAVQPGAPSFNGEVWAVVSDGTSIYVGGEFSTVAGVSRPGLVKLNADGTVNTAFNANLRGGRVRDLHMYNGPAGRMLFVGGSAGPKLFAVNPATGANTGYFDLAITDKIPNSFGDVTIHNFAINPDQDKLIAVGNFMTVDGQSRMRAFRANLPGTGKATLAPWYYTPFEKNCRLTTPRRLAYLTDVDFSPDGRYFVITATGHNPATREDWETMVCDAAARFETSIATPNRPSWINYTGGDTIWSVAVTGKAVYVQGHFQHLDNKYGVGDQTAPTAVDRLGVGAINPDLPSDGGSGGEALPWNPGKPAKQGGKQLLATADGLWVVSDSRRFNGEPRYGIALAPLP